MAELLNVRLDGLYIEQFSHCVPRAMVPITGIRKRLIARLSQRGAVNAATCCWPYSKRQACVPSTSCSNSPKRSTPSLGC